MENETDSSACNTKVIAVAGKGGVEKTTIAAVTSKLLTQNNPRKKNFAIDSDLVIGLFATYGVKLTTTISDIKNAVVSAVKNHIPVPAYIGNKRNLATYNLTGNFCIYFMMQ